MSESLQDNISVVETPAPRTYTKFIIQNFGMAPNQKDIFISYTLETDNGEKKNMAKEFSVDNEFVIDIMRKLKRLIKS